MFEIVMIVVGGVFAIVGGVGFWQYLISRRGEPIKVREADLAVASTTQAMALQIAADLRTDLDQLRKDFVAEREARQKLEGRQEGFESQMREQNATIARLRDLLQAFSYAWDDLVENWEALRQRSAPPKKPTANIH